MTAQGWDRKVFRLRKLPSHISSLAETANILSRALSLPIDDIVVYSIGRTTDIWEVPPFKVATLQLKSIPTFLRDRLAENEWSIPTTSNLPIDDLLLDTHFEGLTALNDVDPAKHSAEYVDLWGACCVRSELKSRFQLYRHLRLGKSPVRVLATSRQ
jgi:aminopeptidase-like protein